MAPSEIVHPPERPPALRAASATEHIAILSLSQRAPDASRETMKPVGFDWLGPGLCRAVPDTATA